MLDRKGKKMKGQKKKKKKEKPSKQRSRIDSHLCQSVELIPVMDPKRGQMHIVKLLKILLTFRFPPPTWHAS